MASDVDATISFWRTCFDAEVMADEAMAGTRNVFLQVGGGRLNLYDQAPNHRGPVNHLGVHVADLEATVRRLTDGGWQPRPIKQDGSLSYSMVEGPDGLLLEVFHFDNETADHLRPYFDIPPRDLERSDLERSDLERADLGRDDFARRQDAESHDPVGSSGPDIGAGVLSPEAEARLARTPLEPLRPPAMDDAKAIDRWRDSIHRGWLQGDPSAAVCGHHQATLGGVRCLRTRRPPDSDSPPMLIYFHGGGYILGSPEVSLPITERLAERCEVVSVDYRLAPEYSYPAAVDDAVAVYRALIAEQPDRPIVVAGDSAGANVALSLAIAARNLGLADRIRAMILLSPHLDHRPELRRHVDDPQSDVDDVTEAWLSAAYRGGRSPDDPMVSPLLADLDGLPPTLVQAGTADASLTDAARFGRLARAAGVAVTLDVWDRLWHTWHYHREVPEAAQALAEATRFAAANCHRAS